MCPHLLHHSTSRLCLLPHWQADTDSGVTSLVDVKAACLHANGAHELTTMPSSCPFLVEG